MKETGELKAARKEIKELKAAQAGARTGWLLESSFLGIARVRPGTTAEGLQKKNAVSLAGRRKRRVMQ